MSQAISSKMSEIYASKLNIDKKHIKTRRFTTKKSRQRKKISRLDRSSKYASLGVKNVILSEDCQEILGCLAGEDLTFEKPWIFVKKSCIIKNMKKNAEFAEFLPYKKEIMAYSEEKILVGLASELPDNRAEFYLVLTIDAKLKILDEIEQHDKQMQERILKLVHRPAGQWKSMGSENEVDEITIKNRRPLYEITINTKIPVYDNEIYLNTRRVEDVRDGYVELLHNPRYPLETVNRKRIDSSVQAVPECESLEVQTIASGSLLVNKYTQYEYQIIEYQEETEDEKKKRIQAGLPDIKEFIVSRGQTMNAPLLENSYLNIFVDDYAELCKNDFRKRLSSIKQRCGLSLLMNFIDKHTSKGDIVTDMSWNDFVTGIIAVCYTAFPLNIVIKKMEWKIHCRNIDEVTNAVAGCTPVIIWSYVDDIVPQLYLNSPRQVTYVTFCPYVKDILVGGLINGQIIIWDLRNTTIEMENIDVMTADQINHRHILYSLMDWMKFSVNLKVIEPTAISDIRRSHRDMITNITWMYEGREIRTEEKLKTGTHRKKHFQSKNIQFISGSLDGTILAWDVNITKTRRSINLVDISKPIRLEKERRHIKKELEMKELNKIIKPNYKIILNENNQPCPITTIYRQSYTIAYEPIDSNLDLNPKKRSLYKISELKPIRDPPFIIGSIVGKVHTITWKDKDLDTGRSFNTEISTMTPYQSIHDGPIVYCSSAPVRRDILLTIGGKIFAIWKIGNDRPILWRKANGSTYISGGWTTQYCPYIVLIRDDSTLEFWDLLTNNSSPTRCLHLSKHVHLFGSLTSPHSRKNTFALSDMFGLLNIVSLSTLLPIHNLDDRANLDKDISYMFYKMDEHKMYEAFLQEKHRVTRTSSSIISHESTFTEKTPSTIRLTLAKNLLDIEKVNKIFKETTWDSVEEQEMYKTLLRNNNLNLVEINAQRIPLQRIANDKKVLQEKKKNYLKNKNKLFDTATAKLFEDSYTKHVKYCVNDNQEQLFLSEYLLNYEEVKERALKYINDNQYCYTLDLAGIRGNAILRKRYIQHLMQRSYYSLKRKQDVASIDKTILQEYNYTQFLSSLEGYNKENI